MSPNTEPELTERWIAQTIDEDYRIERVAKRIYNHHQAIVSNLKAELAEKDLIIFGWEKTIKDYIPKARMQEVLNKAKENTRRVGLYTNNEIGSTFVIILINELEKELLNSCKGEKGQ